MDPLCVDTLTKFRRLCRADALFHCSFFVVAWIELLGGLCFFPSLLFAAALATLFLTGFTYLVLRFYFEAKKPQQMLALQETFCECCTGSLVSSIHGLLGHLQNLEQELASTRTLWLGRISARIYGKEFLKMRQLLLLRTAEAQLSCVRENPLQAHAHAATALAYISLYRLYVHPRQEATLLAFAEKAIEELRIVQQLAPQDPWSYTQLAAIYQDLHRVDAQIEALEALLQRAPDADEPLFQLGTLYFGTGKLVKGLQMYALLKERDEERAKQLIDLYPTPTLALEG